MTRGNVTDFLQRIIDKKARIAVIGLGYVGLPVLRAFEAALFDVMGYDKDEARVEAIDRARGAGFVTSNFQVVMGCDVFIVCVPTPLKNGEPDLSYVYDVAALLPENALVVNESTVAPGDTERCFWRSRWLAYSPERVDPGSNWRVAQIPKLIAGRDLDSLQLIETLYGQVFGSLFKCLDIRTAEMAKLIENTYRAVNIALANEFKTAADALNIDVREAIDAASSKPFGFQPFYPGPGAGGHCIPIDPVYLMRAVDKGAGHNPLPLINMALIQNETRPFKIAGNIRARLPSGASILIAGLAYKKNVGDIRESPALSMLKIFKGWGHNVAWYDPYVGRAPDKTTRLMEWSQETVHRFDAVVIVTDHDDVDYSVLSDHPCVFDTRGVMPHGENVHRV